QLAVRSRSGGGPSCLGEAFGTLVGLAPYCEKLPIKLARSRGITGLGGGPGGTEEGARAAGVVGKHDAVFGQCLLGLAELEQCLGDLLVAEISTSSAFARELLILVDRQRPQGGNERTIVAPGVRDQRRADQPAELVGAV